MQIPAVAAEIKDEQLEHLCRHIGQQGRKQRVERRGNNHTITSLSVFWITLPIIPQK